MCDPYKYKCVCFGQASLKLINVHYVAVQFNAIATEHLFDARCLTMTSFADYGFSSLVYLSYSLVVVSLGECD